MFFLIIFENILFFLPPGKYFYNAVLLQYPLTTAIFRQRSISLHYPLLTCYYFNPFR